MTVGFVADGRRLFESRAGLQRLGIATERQQYLHLPDGQLSAFHKDLVERIVDYSIKADVSQLVSLGADGFDGHNDHIASYLAASEAQAVLRYDADMPIRHLNLNSQHNGELSVPSTPQRRIRKLGAMSCHASQFDIRHFDTTSTDELIVDGYAIGQSFWEGFKAYRPLVLQAETYDIA